MMIALLLLAAVGACVGEEISQYIVGGERAYVVGNDQHRHYANLQIQSGGSWFAICGAIIYQDRWVCTAAHCLSSPASSYRIKVGSDDMQTAQPLQAYYYFSSWTAHPGWNGNAPGYPNDIALMRTTARIIYNQNVGNFTFFDDQDYSFEGYTTKLKGFGRLTGGGSAARYLKKLNIIKISNSQCESMWQGISGARILPCHICFYSRTGESACNGDSGGPATTTFGRAVLGCTSWGISTCSGAYPSVYTRLSCFKQWMRDTAY